MSQRGDRNIQGMSGQGSGRDLGISEVLQVRNSGNRIRIPASGISISSLELFQGLGKQRGNPLAFSLADGAGNLGIFQVRYPRFLRRGRGKTWDNRQENPAGIKGDFPMENPAGLAAFFLRDGSREGRERWDHGEAVWGSGRKKGTGRGRGSRQPPGNLGKLRSLGPKTAQKIPSGKIPGSDGKIPAAASREGWEAPERGVGLGLGWIHREGSAAIPGFPVLRRPRSIPKIWEKWDIRRGGVVTSQENKGQDWEVIPGAVDSMEVSWDLTFPCSNPGGIPIPALGSPGLSRRNPAFSSSGIEAGKAGILI